MDGIFVVQLEIPHPPPQPEKMRETRRGKDGRETRRGKEGRETRRGKEGRETRRGKGRIWRQVSLP